MSRPPEPLDVTDAKDRLGDRLGARIVAECEQLARIPGLEARIAELEAERDEVRRLLNKNLESSAGVIEQIQAERDEAIYGRKFAEGRRGRTEAERDDARGLADIEAKLANEEHAARERAEAERDAAIKRADETDYAWVVASEKAVQMEAERDRLRVALARIADDAEGALLGTHMTGIWDDADHLCAILAQTSGDGDRAREALMARRALAGEAKPSGRWLTEGQIAQIVAVARDSLYQAEDETAACFEARSVIRQLAGEEKPRSGWPDLSKPEERHG